MASARLNALPPAFHHTVKKCDQFKQIRENRANLETELFAFCKRFANFPSGSQECCKVRHEKGMKFEDIKINVEALRFCDPKEVILAFGGRSI